MLTRVGYALWNLVKACSIRNSEDASIRDKEANDIRGLVELVPSIRRIVFSRAGSARLFLSLQRSWLRSEGRFWLEDVGTHKQSFARPSIQRIFPQRRRKAWS